MPSEQTVGFREPNENCWRGSNDGEGPDVGIGQHAIDCGGAECDQAQDSDDVQRGHEDAPEGIALGSTGDPLATIAEATTTVIAAGVGIHVSGCLDVRCEQLSGNQDTLHQRTPARSFFRYVERDER